MWKAMWTASLLTVVSCRAADAAPPVQAEPGQTTGVRAAQLKIDLESQLVSWEPKDGSVELTVLLTGYLPKYRKGGGGPSADGRIVLKPGEQLTFPDHHIRQEFTFRSATESQLELDYFFRLDGKADAGRIVLTRGLMESGFQERWRGCSATPQCAIIPTYCGGYAGVAKGGPQELAELFFRKIGSRKECGGKAMTAPVASCVEGKCQPAPSFPKK